MRANAGSEAGAHEALADLCRDYWRPLFYFARRKGHSPEDAQDLTQGFIAELLEHNAIARADRDRGRFRTFLISSFCHFLANAQRDRSTQKRGGGVVVVSLDDEEDAGGAQMAVDGTTPEMEYERRWALGLLERVMARLRAEYVEAERGALFDAMEPHLSGAAGRPGYAAIGEALGLSEGTIRVAMHRMRRRYGDLLREEMAATVTTPEEMEDELRHLTNVVAGVPSRL